MKTSLIHYLEETVIRSPQRIAVWDSGREYSFVEVASKSQELARRLHDISSEKSRIVGVFLPKCAGVNIADFGILMSANAFMNLDVKTPIERISGILKTVEPIAVITNEKLVDVIRSAWQGSVLCIDSIMAMGSADIPYVKKWSFFGVNPIDTDPFCIINTSGSTGVPKSVVTPWRCFHNFVLWSIEEVSMKQDGEISASVGPTFFDSWVQDILLMAVNGMTQIQVPESYKMFPIKLLQFMIEKKVTYLLWVPTIMAMVANSGLVEKYPIPTLRHCWYAGEVLPPHQLNKWIRANPDAEFMNLYGPMEVSEVCTFYKLPGEMDENKPIPIGRAIPNYDVVLLSENGDRITSIGKEGEICARGNIAFGYYSLQDKTDSVFCQVPWNRNYEEKIYHTGDYGKYDENGDIVFCGRRDSLIKHSGYRIELSEIEHIIVSSLKLVPNGCAIYNWKLREIVFFYEGERAWNEAEFRKAIATALPKYMIPTDFRHLAQLPRGGTGKIDRAFLNRQVNG